MAYTVEDFKREQRREFLAEATVEELLEGLTPEQILSGMTPAQIRAIRQQIKNNDGR